MNIPNMLSIFRLCLVPAYVLIYFSGFQYARIMAAVIYAVATFTDFLDGYIARKYNQITNLGKVLDPLGDKMLTFAVLACLAIDNTIPTILVVLFFIKEAAMGLGGLIIHRYGHSEIPPSNMLGKSATVCFFIICFVLMAFDSVTRQAAVAMISFALAVSFLAFMSYSKKFVEIMKSKDR